MKKTVLAALLLVTSCCFSFAAEWKNDKAHSQMQFTVTHLGLSDVSGMFTDFDVTVEADKADFSDAVFKLRAKVASINTRVEARDNHLKSADFFDAATHPEITFISKSIRPNGRDKFILTGDLTIHGVTKSVSMDVQYRGKIADEKSGKQTVGFQLTGELKRSDFNVGPNFPEPMISDVVHIKADGEFIKE